MNASPSPFMRRALELAREAAGRTSPNPPVGAVIVRDETVVGEGSTQPPGGAHAEVAALSQAGSLARGGTLYVTLEPCSHFGRTPPCVNAIIDASLAKVIFALVDPDENVRGRGAETLRAAGLEVEAGDGEADAARVLEAYIVHRGSGRPFVIAKYAASLDGKIAAASGDSRWVSGPQTLAWAHEMRTRIDAIMAGVSTVLVDNPRLTARPGGVEAPRQPLRVVVDSHGRTPLHAQVLQGSAATMIATTSAASPSWRSSIAKPGLEVATFPAAAGGRVSLPDLLDELGRRGVVTLLVEGGGVLHGSFFDQRLVDKLHAVIAPLIVGAAKAPGPVAGAGAERMRDAIRLRDVTVDRLGEDVLVTGYPVYGT